MRVRHALNSARAVHFQICRVAARHVRCSTSTRVASAARPVHPLAVEGTSTSEHWGVNMPRGAGNRRAPVKMEVEKRSSSSASASSDRAKRRRSSPVPSNGAASSTAVPTRRGRSTKEETDDNEREVTASDDACAVAVPSTADIEDFSGKIFTDGEVEEFRERLLDWYDKNHRELPWRRNVHSRLPSGEGTDSGKRGGAAPVSAQDFAYRVWVSEIMLQQTQVATVVEYFNRWVGKWPTVAALAKASQEEVNEQWAGLGYYRRARYLLDGAKYVVDNFSGKLPTSADDLRKIPGVGPYTAAAVASIAFGQRSAVVDGNVVRVLCRLRTLNGDWSKRPLGRHIEGLAGQLLDPERPGDCNQALMELGAVQCLKAGVVPCGQCPIQNICLAKAEADRREDVKVNDWPAQAKKVVQRREHVWTAVLCLRRGSSVSAPVAYCMVKRPDGGLLGGMWEFLSLVVGDKALGAKECQAQTDALMGELLPMLSDRKVERRCELGAFTHVFSHIKQSVRVEQLTVRVDAVQWKRLVSGPGEGGFASEGLPARQIKFVEATLLDPSLFSTGVRKVCKLLPKTEATGPSKR